MAYYIYIYCNYCTSHEHQNLSSVLINAWTLPIRTTGRRALHVHAAPSVASPSEASPRPRPLRGFAPRVDSSVRWTRSPRCVRSQRNRGSGAVGPGVSGRKHPGSPFMIQTILFHLVSASSLYIELNKLFSYHVDS